MPDCTGCNRPLGRRRTRCTNCGACEECCDCPELSPTFDADELGLDPETFDTYKQERGLDA